MAKASAQVTTQGALTLQAQANIVRISEILDEWNKHLSKGHQLWQRSGKVGEEFGEVVNALIGYEGQNPRKGQYKTLQDVGEELLDVAITALGAYEHIYGNSGVAFEDLFVKMAGVRMRLEDAINAES